ncbi:MAG: LacI family transcriptional regulator, partial [Cytophagaceae bacterium]
VPNAAARAQATGRTGTVAVLSGPLTDQYYANMVQLLESYLTAHSYEMLLLHTRREVKDMVNAAKVSLVDGVIVVGINTLAEEFLRLSGSVQPCVLIDTSAPDFVDHIALDLRPALKEALELMLNAGRQRIAYIANNIDEKSSLEVRMRVYLDTMAKAGRRPEVFGVDTKLSPEERIQAITRYIQQNGCPDAVLCQNDETAIYTYRAIVELGYRIPHDAFLVGCDGLPYMQYFDTPLSTIVLPMDEICETASRFLQQRMANPNLPIQQATLEGSLVVRKSLSVEM